MRTNFKIMVVILLLALLALACVQAASAPNGEPADYYYPGYEDYDNAPAEVDDDLPAATQMPQPTASPPATQTPDTGGGPTNTPEVFIPVTGGGDESAAPTPIVMAMDLNTVYQEVVGSLPQGSALFNPPEQMRLGDTQTVEVRVVPVTEEQIEEDTEIQATLTADFESGQEVIIIPLRVSTIMRARLSGAAFTIKPLMEDEQIKSPDAPYLRWIWEVTPEESGPQRLTLTLSVVVNAEGLGDKTHVTTEVRDVTVQVNPIYSVTRFMNSNWEWVVTGVLVPVIGWGWSKLRRRS